MSSLLELRSKLSALESQAADLRKRIEVEEAAASGKRDERVRNATKEEKAKCEECFVRCDNGSKGFILPVDFLDVAKEMGLPLSEVEAKDMMLGFDLDKDGRLDRNEFARWYYCGTGTPLRSLIRREELRQSLIRISRETPRAKPWDPTVKLHATMTIGEVGDDFVPKAGWLLSALPCSKEDLVKCVGALIDEFVEPDDDDEVVPKKDATAGVITANVRIRDEASDQEVSECLEVLNAMCEEYSAQDDFPFYIKVKPSNVQGKRYFRVAVAARQDERAEKRLKMMQEMMAMVGLKEIPQETKFLMGFETSCNIMDVWSIKSQLPLITLWEKMRMVIHADIPDESLAAIDALVVSRIESDEISLDRRKGRREVINAMFAKMLSSLEMNFQFDSPRALLRDVLNKLSQAPKEIFGDAVPEDRQQKFAEEIETFKIMAEAAFQRKRPWMLTFPQAVLGPRATRKFIPREEGRTVIAIIGPDGCGKTRIIDSLCGRKPQFDVRDAIRIEPATIVGKKVFLVEVPTNYLGFLLGVERVQPVVCINTESKETVQESIRSALLVFKAGCNECTYAFTKQDKPGSISKEECMKMMVEPFAKSDCDKDPSEMKSCVCFASNPSAPFNDELLKELVRDVDAETEDNESEKDEEEGEDESGMMRQLMNHVFKVVGSVEDIFVTSEVMDAHLHINAPLGAMPASSAELRDAATASAIAFNMVSKAYEEVGSASFDLDTIYEAMEKVEEDREQAYSQQLSYFTS